MKQTIRLASNKGQCRKTPFPRKGIETTKTIRRTWGFSSRKTPFPRKGIETEDELVPVLEPLVARHHFPARGLKPGCHEIMVSMPRSRKTPFPRKGIETK